MELSELKVIVAEDDTEDAKNIKRSLEKESVFVKIDVVSDGQELMEFLETNRSSLPTVILTDLNMPRMDGYEVLQEVLQDADFSNVPVIVYTTSSSEYCFTKCKDLGAKAVLVKPFDFKEIEKLPAQIMKVLKDL